MKASCLNNHFVSKPKPLPSLKKNMKHIFLPMKTISRISCFITVTISDHLSGGDVCMCEGVGVGVGEGGQH